jgi:CXXC-20-CXXC protein
MKRFRTGKCPYCGKKISFLSTWFLKSQGEFVCPKCGEISNITIDPIVYLLAFFAIFLSTIFFACAYLNNKTLNLWIIILIVLPFFLFFLLSAFLVRFKKFPVYRNDNQKNMMQKSNKNKNY